MGRRHSGGPAGGPAWPGRGVALGPPGTWFTLSVEGCGGRDAFQGWRVRSHVCLRVTLRVRKCAEESPLGTELSGTGVLVLHTGDTCGHVTAVGGCAVQCRTRSHGGNQSAAILKPLWGY